MQTLSSVAVFESHLSATLFPSPEISEIINEVLQKVSNFPYLIQKGFFSISKVCS